jgi:hypothetical protein
MAYKDTYRAYAKDHNGTITQWNGLRKSQAVWRYHWIRRNSVHGAAYANVKEYGWQRENQV